MICEQCGLRRWRFCVCGDRGCRMRRCADCDHRQLVPFDVMQARDE